MKWADSVDACIYNIHDRKVNLDLLTSSQATTYAAARAWVNNDPFGDPSLSSPTPYMRTKPPAVPPPLPKMSLENETPDTNRRVATMEDSINGLTGVPPQVLLQSHLAYWRENKKMQRIRYAHRYRRFKTRLAIRGFDTNQVGLDMLVGRPDGKNASPSKVRSVKNASPEQPQVSSTPAECLEALADKAEEQERKNGQTQGRTASRLYQSSEGALSLFSLASRAEEDSKSRKD